MKKFNFQSDLLNALATFYSLIPDVIQAILMSFVYETYLSLLQDAVASYGSGEAQIEPLMLIKFPWKTEGVSYCNW